MTLKKWLFVIVLGMAASHAGDYFMGPGPEPFSPEWWREMYFWLLVYFFGYYVGNMSRPE